MSIYDILSSSISRFRASLVTAEAGVKETASQRQRSLDIRPPHLCRRRVCLIAMLTFSRRHYVTSHHNISLAIGRFKVPFLSSDVHRDAAASCVKKS